MGAINTKTIAEENLTVNTVTGDIFPEDLIEWATKYYSGPVMDFILWDATNADLSKMFTEDLKVIIQEVKKHAHKRAGGKTAIVSSKDKNFGIGRMFETLAEIQGIEFEYRNFRSIEEAKEWFGL